MRLLKNIALFSLLTPVLVSCGGNSVSINERLETASVITTPTYLALEIKENKVRFEQKYDGEYLFVTGSITDIEKDHFWISRWITTNFEYMIQEKKSIKCDVNSKNRSYLASLNKNDRVVAFGRYKYNDFMGLVGELDNCVWNARAPYEKPLMSWDDSDGWDDAMNLTKAKRVIKNAPFARNAQGDLRKDTNPLYNP